MSESELNKLFEQANAEPPQPSSDFLARVLSDGEAMQPALQGLSIPPKRGFAAALRSGFAQFGDMIGGWPALAGLSSAAIAGVWIGLSQPDMLSDPLSSVISRTFGSSFDVLMETGTESVGFDFTQFEG